MDRIINGWDGRSSIIICGWFGSNKKLTWNTLCATIHPDEASGFHLHRKKVGDGDPWKSCSVLPVSIVIKPRRIFSRTGTMTKLNYNQFSGTIQVMKAVGNHMVLTFCQSMPGSQLFSIVVSRKANTLTVDVNIQNLTLFFSIFYRLTSIFSSTGSPKHPFTT